MRAAFQRPEGHVSNVLARPVVQLLDHVWRPPLNVCAAAMHCHARRSTRSPATLSRPPPQPSPIAQADCNVNPGGSLPTLCWVGSQRQRWPSALENSGEGFVPKKNRARRDRTRAYRHPRMAGVRGAGPSKTGKRGANQRTVVPKTWTNCGSGMRCEFLGVNVRFLAREDGCPPPVTGCRKASLTTANLLKVSRLAPGVLKCGATPTPHRRAPPQKGLRSTPRAKLLKSAPRADQSC